MTLTAAILIIGNEILSGKTQDINTPFIATRLADRGIKLSEVRVVRDEEHAIVETVRALSQKYTYVFSTGGIGPTHDDITTDCMGKAFNTEIEINSTAKNMLAEYCTQKDLPLTEGRLRMARIPRGAELIIADNSAAPGFRIQNVYVMAGVPKIMQSMFLSIENALQRGAAVISQTISCNLREGDIALELEKIQNAFPDVEIGSYPHVGQTPSLSLILRGTDPVAIETVSGIVLAFARRHDVTAVFSA